ncbi:MAG: DUF2807 domain-containing protein [Legionellaceae bacterium]|nr:DUF2807 domain-containing protein [Legionellaceae bacterium]
MKTSNRLLLMGCAIIIAMIIGIGIWGGMTMPKSRTSLGSTPLISATAPVNQHTKTMIQAGNPLKFVFIEGPVHVTLKPGPSNQVVVKAEDTLFDQLEVTNKDNQLRIHPKSNTLLPSETPIQVEIISDTVERFALSGAIQLTAEALKQAHLTLQLGGQSNVLLSGEVDILSVNLSGASTLNAKQLLANDVSVMGSGQIKAVVYAKDSLSVAAHGSTDIIYYGHPKVTKEAVTGASKVTAGV